LKRRKEEKAMKTAAMMTKVNRWVHEHPATRVPVRILAGVAIGAMLITPTAFIYQELNQDEAARPSSSSQITEASQAPAYWVQRDEAEEMAYDELSKNFVGIAAPSSENSQGLQAPAYWVQRDEAEEMLYDELSKSFVGIAYPSSQTIEAFRDPS
jgi:hypothetical protein